jgi:hypothetical protein
VEISAFAEQNSGDVAEADICRSKNQGLGMSHSMYNADHRTHLKIVVVGFLCATAFAVIGVSSHIGSLDLGTTPLVKAGHPTIVSGELPTVR